MKKSVRKSVSVLLAILMILGMFTALPFSVSAAESTEPVGASSGTTGDCTWTLDDDGVLTISGNGAMEDYDAYESPWGSGVTSVEIEFGVTNIGNYAFSDCTGLTSVTIPDSVTSIGNCAFEYCSGLTSVEIPNSVTSIGDESFWDCTGLTSITIPDSVTSIGYYAFYGCTGLISITIPDSVGYIGDGALYNCSAELEVTCFSGSAGIL